MSEPLANLKAEGMHFSGSRSPIKWFSDPNFCILSTTLRVVVAQNLFKWIDQEGALCSSGDLGLYASH